MISASSLACMLIFRVVIPGLTVVGIGATLYAAFSRIPARGWMKAGISLGCASVGAVIFATMGNVIETESASIFVGIFLTFAATLCILSPIFILADRTEYAPDAGILTIAMILFGAAATGGLIQSLNITAFLSAGTSAFSPAILFLFTFAIMGAIYIVLGAEFFIFACLVKQRRKRY